MKVDC